MILPVLNLAVASPRATALPPMTKEELWSPLPVHHIDVDGLDIAYVDSDPEGGKPPILLVHGLSSQLAYWERPMGALAATHRVIALDLPGYGRSSKPDAPYTPPWYAGVVVAFMDAVGLDQLPIMGHSMGGQIALTLALEHPDRVTALLLSAPAGIETFRPGERTLIKAYWHEQRARSTSAEEVRAAFTQAVFAHADASVERWIEERIRISTTDDFAATSVAVSRSIAGMVDHPVADRLGAIAVPTLVVYGVDDRMIPNPLLHGGSAREIGRQAERAIPGCTVAMIPDGGHTVHHDEPEAFMNVAAAFLANLPTSGAPAPAVWR